MNTKSFKAVAFSFALMLALAAAPAFPKSSAQAPKGKALELQEALRGLWLDHIFWARSVVLSSSNGDVEGAKMAEGHVVQNAKAIAGAMVPFYGKEAGDKLFGLLAGHYGAVKAYTVAAFSNDKRGMEKARNDLMTNGEEIAIFLSSANPNWPKETLDSLLMTHGAHHLVQVEAIGRKDFSSEAVNWVSMKEHMNMIADALAAGLAKQFPEKV